MELSYKEEVGVGAIVLLGLVAFTLGMFWLTGRSITSKAVAVRVEFRNVSGLKEGDPVRVSGAKFIDYNPGVNDTLLPQGAPIRGITEEQFADVASRAATSANELIANVNKGLNPGELAADIHNTLLATQRGMSALTEAATGPAVQQTRQTLAALERVMVRFDTLLGATSPAQTGKRLDTLSVNLAELSKRLADATGSLKSVLDKMNRGEGTFGRMASDTLLYHNLNATLASLDALLKDLRERPGRYLTVEVF